MFCPLQAVGNFVNKVQRSTFSTLLHGHQNPTAVFRLRIGDPAEKSALPSICQSGESGESGETEDAARFDAPEMIFLLCSEATGTSLPRSWKTFVPLCAPFAARHK